MKMLTAAQFTSLIELRDAMHRAVELGVVTEIAKEVTERDSVTDFMNAMTRLCKRELGTKPI
ncbi:hypothetical protein [Burkholderia sp. Bp8998]|uniref:hypothetical protein n=1 Tax=Burkholderia sp. Bp8998 TaxID=2184557 RepID=UPI000F5742AF|nr:hypothetical protein [Burkholderia sp. Bp8998]RQR63861.1 hypothetical protein DIE18_06940 [Burkholderia sp. Bp9125]RQS17103.1 hypothetical protein DIE06_18150 [Burkholderia sp. Bp8998]